MEHSVPLPSTMNLSATSPNMMETVKVKKGDLRNLEGGDYQSERDNNGKVVEGFEDIYDKGLTFCEKAKGFLTPDDYLQFLKCLHYYSLGVIEKNDMQNMVGHLLGTCPDLMHGFDNFLVHCEEICGGQFACADSNKSDGGGGYAKSRRVEKSNHVLKTAKARARAKTKAKAKDRRTEKYKFQSVQNLDLSNCENCSPSYWHLPEDYPIACPSERTELGSQVLNDHWVSKPVAESFNQRCINKHEEVLFRCEDDQFRMDMLIESVRSAARCTQKLMDNINSANIPLDTPIKPQNHFSVLNLRCIEHMYGKSGCDALKILGKNPFVVLPVILTCLRQKEDELGRSRTELNKTWSKVYGDNHYKALGKKHDSRSFNRNLALED